MKFRVTYNENIPQPFKDEILAIFAEYEWLVPRWVQSIHFNLWNGESDSMTMIQVEVMYEYRDVRLDFFTGWLNQKQEDKIAQVVHEILHMHLALVADYARSKFDLLCPSDEAPKFHQTIQDELRARHESATQDLANSIFLKMGGNSDEAIHTMANVRTQAKIQSPGRKTSGGAIESTASKAR